MEKAIGSKVNLKNLDDTLAIEFMSCISDIYYNEKIQKLNKYEQHCHTSRLQHSINVAYYSFIICKFLGWDFRSAARAGLMHDMFYYDWRTKNTARKRNHAAWHPRVAYDNARKITNVNDIEKDAIIKHMWPCTFALPKYKESYVVTFVDKTCAVFEAVGNTINRLINKK